MPSIPPCFACLEVLNCNFETKFCNFGTHI
jgi:hypothetical protein